MTNFTPTLFSIALLGGAGCSSDAGPAAGNDAGDDDTTTPGDDAPPVPDGVSTLAGAPDPGKLDGVRDEARFANPVNVAYGPGGKVYVADFDNSRIRAIDPADGTTTTTIAMPGFARPFALAFGADGTLYVSTDRDPQGRQDPMSGTVWRIDVAAGTAAPLMERIGRPRGIAALPDGRLAISDYVHHVVRLLDPRTGALLPLAGAWDAPGMIDGLGGAARLSTPYGVAVVNGQIIVADRGNHRLRAIGLDGRVTTFAGTGTPGFSDGPAANVRLNNPQGLAAAANGDLYLTDLENYRVRRISSGLVETIAGSGTPGSLDSPDRLAAQIYGLEGVAVTPDGSMVFVADGGRGQPVPHNMIRRVKMQ